MGSATGTRQTMTKTSLIRASILKSLKQSQLNQNERGQSVRTENYASQPNIYSLSKSKDGLIFKYQVLSHKSLKKNPSFYIR